MRLMPVLIGAAAVAALGGVAYAATKHDEHPPLPLPTNKCTSAQDVGQATTTVLSDPSSDSAHIRAAADVLRDWEANGNTFCDQEAKQAAMVSIQMLEAKATALDHGPGTPQQPTQAPPLPINPNLLPLPIPWPGYVGSQAATGLHGEHGTLYWYSNGDEWFIPDDHTLVPYYIPGGSLELPHATTGSCCAACERGEECTGCQ